jgi:hypothetical protein
VLEANESSRPEGDGSLLQLISKLAGEPWTERPTCVHAVLVSVASAAHDHSTEAGRVALRALAPRFIGTAQTGFETSARLAALCTSTALAGPDLRCITPDEEKRLVAARETALYLLRSGAGARDEELHAAADEPGLRGAARWWFPVLGAVRLSEPFYRCWVAGAQAAEAVAVTARTAGADRDSRLRQLLRLCLQLTLSMQASERGR